MSRPYFLPGAQFKAELHAEELIHVRISECDAAFADGELNRIQNTVIALENHLLGEDIATPDFLAELKKIEHDLKEAQDAEMLEYMARRAKALCPDVVPKPSRTPPLEYWREKYIRMKVLISKKGMWLKQSREVNYG